MKSALVVMPLALSYVLAAQQTLKANWLGVATLIALTVEFLYVNRP